MCSRFIYSIRWVNGSVINCYLWCKLLKDGLLIVWFLLFLNSSARYIISTYTSTERLFHFYSWWCDSWPTLYLSFVIFKITNSSLCIFCALGGWSFSRLLSRDKLHSNLNDVDDASQRTFFSALNLINCPRILYAAVNRRRLPQPWPKYSFVVNETLTTSIIQRIH